PPQPRPPYPPSMRNEILRLQYLVQLPGSNLPASTSIDTEYSYADNTISNPETPYFTG
ncbi:MAG: hypothetical protein Q9177_005642, partial [Variospora cf. flavescens]